jgi:hypothetical protein
MLNPATGKVRSAQIEEGATVGERVAVESIRREPQSKGSALQEGRVTSAPRKNPLERGFNTPPSRVRDEESWDRSERVQERRDIRKRTLVNGQFPSIANGGFQSRIAPQGVVTIAGRAIGIKVFVVALIVGVVFGALGGVFLYSALNRETGLGVEEDISSSISPSRSAGLGE